jgi:transketolase
LKLGKLIYLFEGKDVTLSAGTNIATNEDCAQRFQALGTQSVADGNDLAIIENALRAVRSDLKRPSLILVRTHLGFGSLNMQDTFEARGSPLGVEEVALTKQKLGRMVEPLFRSRLDRRTAETASDRGYSDATRIHAQLEIV